MDGSSWSSCDGAGMLSGWSSTAGESMSMRLDNGDKCAAGCVFFAGVLIADVRSGNGASSYTAESPNSNKSSGDVVAADVGGDVVVGGVDGVVEIG